MRRGADHLPRPVAQTAVVGVVELGYRAAEPLGIEGIEAGDDLAEREGKLVLGALGIGGKKMKTHKACVRRLFERSDLVLNSDGVYAVATEIV